MNSQISASVAVVAITNWRSERGEPRSTIVGKLTMQLADDHRAALVSPEPLSPFDRLTPDGRHVSEASELAPWTSIASVLLNGGPARFTLENEAGAPLLVATASARSPLGYGMSSPERSVFARRPPTRAADGVLTIPDDVDGRYFVAAPKAHQLASLRGDERFTLELTGWWSKRRLPGFVVTATVGFGSRYRVVALTPDMLVVDGRTRRISIVSRALVHGTAALLTHAVVPLGDSAGADVGDTRERAAASFADASRLGGIVSEETTDASALSAPHGLVAPFDLDPPSIDRSRVAPAVPATPFDPGFAPAAVMPGLGVATTMTAQEEMADQLRALRNSLRSQGLPPAPAPVDDATSPSPNEPEVAPPRPGAMAKPRLKRK